MMRFIAELVRRPWAEARDGDEHLREPALSPVDRLNELMALRDMDAITEARMCSVSRSC